jgi:hypothetical protein
MSYPPLNCTLALRIKFWAHFLGGHIEILSVSHALFLLLLLFMLIIQSNGFHCDIFFYMHIICLNSIFPALIWIFTYPWSSSSSWIVLLLLSCHQFFSIYHITETWWYLYLGVWLISLNMTIWMITHCAYIPQFLYPCICWWTCKLIPWRGYGE